MTLAPPIADLPLSERVGRIRDLLMPGLTGLRNKCSDDTEYDLTERDGGLRLTVGHHNVAGEWMQTHVRLASADEIASGEWRPEIYRRMTDAFAPFVEKES